MSAQEKSLEVVRPNATALATRVNDSLVIRPKDMSELIEFAKMVAFSGMAPKDFVGNPGAVLVAVQMGAELGLTPMAALQNIAVINGRPALWGDAGLAIIKTHPDFVDIIEEWTDDLARCTVKRRGNSDVVRTFTQRDAETAKLWNKPGPWQQYPDRMLQMRARWWALRDQFPDALRGIYSVDEAQDIPPDNAPLSKSWSTAIAAPAPDAPKETAASKQQANPQAVAMLHAFESLGVSREMVERRCGRVVEQLEAHEVEALRAVYADVKQNPRRKAEVFGQAPSAADAVNQRFAQAAEHKTEHVVDVAEKSQKDKAGF